VEFGEGGNSEVARRIIEIVRTSENDLPDSWSEIRELVSRCMKQICNHSLSLLLL
jgi:hypothetical protein